MEQDAVSRAAMYAHQLRDIVTYNADGILVVDDDGVVRFINPAGAKLLGHAPDQIIGQEFGHPVAGSGRAEIDLLPHHRDSHRIAEMHVVETVWDDEQAFLITLRDVTEQRTIQEALRNAETFNWAILNALNHHIAVLDEHGTIVAVNESWRNFALDNSGADNPSTSIGANYFAICDNAYGLWSEGASEAVEGMRAVLRGERPNFELEYPCHAPNEERWFLLRVVPLHGQRPGLVIAHTNITTQKISARIAAEAENLRERLKALEQELQAVEQISDRPTAAELRQPLSRRDSKTFQRLVERYGQLLEQALEQRAHQPPDQPPAVDTRAIASELGSLAATPRDVINLHMAALRQRSHGATPAKLQAYVAEGRVMVLELMGHLAGWYRIRALKQNDYRESS